MTDKKIMRVTLTISILLYAISLFQIGYTTAVSSKDDFGAFLVIFGAFSFWESAATFSWLANPTLWISWGKVNSLKKAFWTSLISTVFALSFLFFDEISAGDCGGTDVVGPCEIPNVEILSIEPGYYFWLSACVVMLVGNGVRLHIENNREFASNDNPADVN